MTPPLRRLLRDRDPARPLPGALDALRAIDARARPNLKRAVPAVLIALVVYSFGSHLAGVNRTEKYRFSAFGAGVTATGSQLGVIVLGFAIVFIVAGVIATRSVAGELGRVSEVHGGVPAGSAVRLIVSILGYATVFFGLLGLLRVNLGNLLVGGAVTGVVVGIAAQQTLGNFFAGLVLLFARPYVPGQRVKIRTGAMGGPFEGVILGAGLMYTSIDTAEGVVSMPNSGLLAAAIGPIAEPVEEEPDESNTAVDQP